MLNTELLMSNSSNIRAVIKPPSVQVKFCNSEWLLSCVKVAFDKLELAKKKINVSSTAHCGI